MKRRRILRYSIATVIIVLTAWTILTLYVEKMGPSRQWKVAESGSKKALVVFDPDPFYNLDEKVCRSFSKALAEKGFSVTMMTVSAAQEINNNNYDVFVLCANTYNWRPDWAITNYIENNLPESGSEVVAITLGAGSTESSQKKFEQLIQKSGGKLTESYSLWLWRPNDETKMETPNVEVAQDMAYDWGIEIANKIN